MITKQVFDYIVIGGGSGGLASARRAASYGAKVALVEADRLGGTCVIRGCVPKKVTYNLTQLFEAFQHDGVRYGLPPTQPNLKYSEFKRMRDAYVDRLNQIYFKNLEKDQVTYVHGLASFASTSSSSSNGTSTDLIPLTITPVSTTTPSSRFHFSPDHMNPSSSSSSTSSSLLMPASAYTILGKKVLIATGGRPYVPDLPGKEWLDTSDTFFEWTDLPKSVIVVGTGYIGMELSAMLHTLGCEVHIFSRSSTVLKTFDQSLQEKVIHSYTQHLHLPIHFNVQITNIEPISTVTTTSTTTTNNHHHEHAPKQLLQVHYLEQGQPRTMTIEKVIMATGRVPNIEYLNLPPQIQLASTLTHSTTTPTSRVPHILVDDFQNTHVPNVYALGDVCGKAELTPVAIAAGRALSDRLFGMKEKAKLNYDLIPTVVFSHPPLGTIGLTEQEARKTYGRPEDQLKIYTSSFINMYYALPGLDGSLTEKPTTFYKLICVGPEERIVGLHLFGKSSDEILQGFAVAIKMGACKKDFDQTVAIHPTAAEELVTMR